ncbi:hypothetical protein [Spirosoma lacussanchae]|uniref:hypothetical protein n=1 Tax=Spirosoma lacussanchae TaxID=1884249 RepID=UPI001109EB39|nr:hypothetical protein [Spirosoma lacussanchae]
MRVDKVDYQKNTSLSERPVHPLLLSAGWVLAVIVAVAIPFGETLFAGLHSAGPINELARKP